jgi:hypothetical protein
MNKERLNAILDKCRILVSNANDPVIAAALLPFGYNSERIQSGMLLYTTTKESFQLQAKEYTDQYYATSAFVAAFDAAKKSFSNFVKIARIAFKNNIEGQRLLPLIAKIQAYSEFKAKATAFYSIVGETDQLLDELAVYGVTPQQLTTELNSLNVLEALNQKQFIETGEAQVATETRNHNLEQLREYCSALRTVAKVALADQPQQLEKLGIMARNGNPAKASPAAPPEEPNR